MLPIILGVCVGGGIMLLFLGLASSSPIDPVQARLTQLEDETRQLHDYIVTGR